MIQSFTGLQNDQNAKVTKTRLLRMIHRQTGSRSELWRKSHFIFWERVAERGCFGIHVHVSGGTLLSTPFCYPLLLDKSEGRAGICVVGPPAAPGTDTTAFCAKTGSISRRKWALRGGGVVRFEIGGMIEHNNLYRGKVPDTYWLMILVFHQHFGHCSTGWYYEKPKLVAIQKRSIINAR